ncbi:DEAD-box ATP-dependent RNA helicase 39-like [Arachis hypogaea]
MEISESKLAKQCSSPDNEHSNVSIGLLLGTPSEIIQYIEEGSVVPAEIRYMVLDDLDFMLGSGLGSNIHKILEPLQDHESTSSYKRFQTVLVTSSITEVLGDESPIVKHLERDHAENIYVIDIGLVI